MTKRVYFLRHPQTDENESGVYLGPDAKVTEVGERQIDIVVERAMELNPGTIVSSNYERAIRLATQIHKRLELVSVVRASRLFNEVRKPSSLIGLSRSDSQSKEIMAEIRSRFDEDHAHSDEETRSMLEARIKEALQFLEQLPEQTILVTTHCKFLFALFHYVYTGGSLKGYYESADRVLRHDNTGITTFTFEPDYRTGQPHWHCVSWNDVSHKDSFIPLDLRRQLERVEPPRSWDET